MTEIAPGPITASISSNLLRVLPLMESAVTQSGEDDNASVSTDSTCSSCVSSCPSFINEKELLGHYRLVKTLGIGEFGKVKLGVHTESHQKVAIKVVDKIKNTVAKLAKVEREIQILKSLRHPHIVKLIEVVETDTRIGIVLEYASGGELFEYVVSHRSLEENKAVNLFAQLISSVNHMHLKGVAHRDLKLENLLFLDAEQTQLVVSDFGFANNDKKDLLSTYCGSPSYAAPELIFPSGGYNGTAADIWSCGVILFCMICGYLPFDDDPDNPAGDNILLLYQYIRSSPLTFPTFVSDEAQDLIRHMLQPDPVNRCNLDFVMNHPWLHEYRHTLFDLSTEDLEHRALHSIQHLLPCSDSALITSQHQNHNHHHSEAESYQQADEKLTLEQVISEPEHAQLDKIEEKSVQMENAEVLPSTDDCLHEAQTHKHQSHQEVHQRDRHEPTDKDQQNIQDSQNNTHKSNKGDMNEVKHETHDPEAVSQAQVTDLQISGERLQHPMDTMPPTPSSLLETPKMPTNSSNITATSSSINDTESSFLPPLPPVTSGEEAILNDSGYNGQQRQRQPSLRRQKKFRPSYSDEQPLPVISTIVQKNTQENPSDIAEEDSNIIGIRPSSLVKDNKAPYYSSLLNGDLSAKIKEESGEHDGGQYHRHKYNKHHHENKVHQLKSTSLPLLNQKSTRLAVDCTTSTTNLADAINQYKNGANNNSISNINSNINADLPVKRHKRLISMLSLSAPRPQRSQSTHIQKSQPFDVQEHEKDLSPIASSIPVVRKRTVTQTVKEWIHKKKHFMKQQHSSSSSLSTSNSSEASDRVVNNNNNNNNNRSSSGSSDHHEAGTNHRHPRQPHHYLEASSSPSSLETTTVDQSIMRTLSHAHGENLTSMDPRTLIVTLVRILTILGIDVHHRSSYQLTCLRKSCHHHHSASKHSKKSKSSSITTPTIYGPPDLDHGHHVEFTVEICRSLLPDLYLIDVQLSHGDGMTFQFLKSKVLGLVNLN